METVLLVDRRARVRFARAVLVLTLCALASLAIRPAAPAAAQEEQPAVEHPDGIPTHHVSPRPDEVSGERQAVIPAGQEERLAEMLGKGVVLAGDCTFSGGRVERRLVRATYTCGTGEIAIRLEHPSTAPSGALQTEQFAVSVASGTPPDGFLEALRAHIRARETGFEWKWIGSSGSSSSSAWLIAAVALLAALAGLAWVLWSRRRPAT